MLVAETAGVGPGSEILDVGFGFADQDMLWVDRLSPAYIIGINITPLRYVSRASGSQRAGWPTEFELIEGKFATAMPLPDARFDQVVGVECAFHFDTREHFSPKHSACSPRRAARARRCDPRCARPAPTAASHPGFQLALLHAEICGPGEQCRYLRKLRREASRRRIYRRARRGDQ